MKVKYEAQIGSYSFQMVDDNMIEVWGYDNDRPETFIYVRDGSIRNEKDFHYEIMSWVSKNVDG